VVLREATEFDEIADVVIRQDIGTVLSPFTRPLIRERRSRFAPPSTSFGLQMHFGLSGSPQ
jgi:hypothetical protein